VNNQPPGVIWWNNLMANGAWSIVKIFIMIGLLMYALFALVVVKQVGVMTETFDSEANSSVKTFALIHLLFSVFLVIIAAIIL
jgi:Family of unknown function (DUF5657)